MPDILRSQDDLGLKLAAGRSDPTREEIGRGEDFVNDDTGWLIPDAQLDSIDRQGETVLHRDRQQ